MSMSRRAVPVTEVTDASQIQNLRWHEQGDARFQDADMLQRRAALRRDKVVLTELNVWWDAALHGSFSAAALGRGTATYEADELDGGMGSDESKELKESDKAGMSGESGEAGESDESDRAGESVESYEAERRVRMTSLTSREILKGG